MIRRRLLVAVTALAISAGVALPMATLAVPRPAPAQEPHPVIREVMEKIESARTDLVKYADRDFKGHRAKAVAHLNQAMEELKLALEADKH